MTALLSALTGNISIHASRVGGDDYVAAIAAMKKISIHASRVGGDACGCVYRITEAKFQSTPPGWEATLDCPACSRDRLPISIHASRVGGDCKNL